MDNIKTKLQTQTLKPNCELKLEKLDKFENNNSTITQSNINELINKKIK